MDIGFAIDGSGSIGEKNFQLIIDFVKSFVSSLAVSKQEARVGAVVYGSRPKRILGFEEGKSVGKVLNKLDHVR